MKVQLRGMFESIPEQVHYAFVQQIRTYKVKTLEGLCELLCDSNRLIITRWVLSMI